VIGAMRKPRTATEYVVGLLGVVALIVVWKNIPPPSKGKVSIAGAEIGGQLPYPTCKTDYTKCKDNTDLHEHNEAVHSLRYDCKTQATKLAKYGDPQWSGPLEFFAHFRTGADEPKTGKAILIDKSARFQNGFGAMVHTAVICKVDLTGEYVVDVHIAQ
jgi:hypothetical protein